MKILIDNGHGNNTKGKQSPDGVLREYKYTREIAERLVDALRDLGYDAERIVTEEWDVSIRERCRRVNAACARIGSKNCLLVSIHCNAAGSDGKWYTARGWSAHVSLNASIKSKTLARCLINAADQQVLKVRRYDHHAPYWSQNLGICRDTNCPAVLTENLFMDSRDDVRILLSEDGKQKIVNTHVCGIINYINSL